MGNTIRERGVVDRVIWKIKRKTYIINKFYIFLKTSVQAIVLFGRCRGINAFSRENEKVFIHNLTERLEVGKDVLLEIEDIRFCELYGKRIKINK